MCKTHIFPFSPFASVLLVVLSACSQAPQQGPKESKVESQGATLLSSAETCDLYSAVATDFINLYVRHLNDVQSSANAPDTYEWLKSNSLVDPAVASAYAKVDLVDGDPILDAQEYPDSFESIGCPEAPDIVRLKGSEMDLSVDVWVASVANGAKVVGAGRLNMKRDADSIAHAEESSTTGGKALPEDSSEAIRRLKAYDDARNRGENYGPGDSSHFTGFDPSIKFLGKYPAYTDLDCGVTQGEKKFWCAHGRMGSDSDMTVSEQVTFLFNEDVYEQQGNLVCSQYLCTTSAGKLAGALQPDMWRWMQVHCKFDDRYYYQCDS